MPSLVAEALLRDVNFLNVQYTASAWASSRRASRWTYRTSPAAAYRAYPPISSSRGFTIEL